MGRLRCAYVDGAYGGQVHLRETGSGPPVLLLHKTPTSSLTYTRVLPLLAAAGYRAIAMDTPGYGQSDRPAETPTEMTFYADVVRDVLDALGIERVRLVGFYTGAKIALETAASHPERVSSLVLSGISINDDAAQKEAYKAFIQGLGHMRFSIDLDVNGAFLEEYPLSWFRDIIHGDGEQYLLELIAYLQSARNYWWGYRASEGYGGADRLALVRCPLLVLNPVGGLSYVVEKTRLAAERVPGARYVEIPGTTEVCMEDPAAWATPVAAFLRDADAGLLPPPAGFG